MINTNVVVNLKDINTDNGILLPSLVKKGIISTSQALEFLIDKELNDISIEVYVEGRMSNDSMEMTKAIILFTEIDITDSIEYRAQFEICKALHELVMSY